MASQVYPTPPTNPLFLTATGATGDKGSISTITEPTGMQAGGVMYIRVAVSDSGDPPATTSAIPTIWLRADTGDPVMIPISTVRERIYNRPGTDPQNRVARANINPSTVADDVYQVEITVDKPGSTWELQIRNNDDKARNVVLAVSDDAGQCKQPWIEVPHEIKFAPHNTRSIRQILIRNRGTGDLEIRTKPGQLNDAGFEITDVPPQPIRPNSTGFLELTFDPAASTGDGTYDLVVDCNDDLASTDDPTASHNKKVRLIGVVPRITSIEPNEGYQNEPIDAVINGQGLAGATAVTFSGSGVTAKVQTGGIDTRVPVKLDISHEAATEGRTFKVKTPRGEVSSEAVMFTVNPIKQQVTRTEPARIRLPQGQPSRSATILGKGLAGTRAVLVSGHGVTATVQPGVTDTQVPIKLSVERNAAVGARTFELATPHGFVTNESVNLRVVMAEKLEVEPSASIQVYVVQPELESPVSIHAMAEEFRLRCSVTTTSRDCDAKDLRGILCSDSSGSHPVFLLPKDDLADVIMIPVTGSRLPVGPGGGLTGGIRELTDCLLPLDEVQWKAFPVQLEYLSDFADHDHPIFIPYNKAVGMQMPPMKRPFPGLGYWGFFCAVRKDTQYPKAARAFLVYVACHLSGDV